MSENNETNDLPQTQARRVVNDAMVQAYWQIGRLIVEDEQGGEQRAAYGQSVLDGVAERLTAEFGRGFSLPNLRNFRQFYLTFTSETIRYTACSELSWSHFRLLMRIAKPDVRLWYAHEAATQGWSGSLGGDIGLRDAAANPTYRNWKLRGRTQLSRPCSLQSPLAPCGRGVGGEGWNFLWRLSSARGATLVERHLARLSEEMLLQTSKQLPGNAWSSVNQNPMDAKSFRRKPE